MREPENLWDKWLKAASPAVLHRMRRFLTRDMEIIDEVEVHRFGQKMRVAVQSQMDEVDAEFKARREGRWR